MYLRGECEYGLNNSDSSEEDIGFQELRMSERIPEGIPWKCFCEAMMSLQVEPTGPDKGRRFYACPRTRSGPHFRRWWDEVIVEEVELLKAKVQMLESRIDTIESGDVKEVGGDVHEVKEAEDIKAKIEIKDFKAKVEELESRITKLESLVGAS